MPKSILKEANETIYWLDLLKDSEYMDLSVHRNLLGACKKIVAMLVSSIKTARFKI
ncbi:four helix bundle protein [Gramella lutea]|uniref:Four helix bundle protein n=1 Tax=Christiangramia lutea TaxID=1607951 RepID=A0A9X1V592_9FLAO|nr:four helix bundle protein [Christiangramia lutea]MCH4824520.1 four helix bundle protein [Christiangramia lutea]